MDEIDLSPEAKVLASRIRTIDRDVDSLDQSARDSVIRGLHGTGFATANNIIQTAADKKRADLLADRADLVVQMKALVSEDPISSRDPGFS